MRNVLIAIVVLGGIVAALLWMRQRDDRDAPATPVVPHGGSSGSSASSSSAVQRTDDPGRLIVTVSDAKGPIAGARVRIAPADGEVVVLETKADGTAAATLAGGSYEVSASAQDHEPAASSAKVEPGANAQLALVLVAGGRRLSGKVMDVSGGPIAGARIDAAKLGGRARPDAAVATALTGVDGSYAMTVAEGQLLVAARSPDYAAQARYVEVGPGGATADFALVPGSVIEGVVLDDRSKQPVGGAIVTAHRDAASILLAEGGARVVNAGPDGRFRITGLRPGAYELAAREGARRTRVATQVGVGVADQVADVQLLIGRAPVVRGTVTDEDGTPVEGARVVTMQNAGATDHRSDAQGRFVVEGLDAGDHVLLALAETHLPAAPTRLTVVDKDVEGVVLRMRKAGRLVGHVEPRQPGCEISLETASDRPLPTEMIARSANDRQTDKDGAFEIAPITPATLQLTARCPTGDHGKTELAWTPAIKDVVIAVTPGASIAGKLLDGEGRAVAGASVVANPITGTIRTTIVNGVVTSGIQGITGATGTYELRGLAPGKYRVTALERGQPLRVKGEPPTVTLAAAEHKTGVDLQVDRPNGVIKGVVTGPDGKPLADAWVSIQQDFESMIRGATGRPAGPAAGPPPGPEGEGESRTVMVTSDGDDSGGGGYAPVLTDAQGRFAITGLPHLAFDVVAEAQAGKLRGRVEGVTPDANLTIKALGVTSLSGVVRGPRGPAALFTVTLEGPTRTQRSFTDGAFSLGRVDPGSYVVKVSSSEGNGEVAVTVAPNTPSTVDVTLVANGVVVGKVVGPDGAPLADAPVVAVDDPGDGRLAISLEGPPPTTGPDGTFRIERKAGKALVVVLGNGAPLRKQVVLEEGKTVDVGTLQLPRPTP